MLSDCCPAAAPTVVCLLLIQSQATSLPSRRRHDEELTQCQHQKRDLVVYLTDKFRDFHLNNFGINQHFK